MPESNPQNDPDNKPRWWGRLARIGPAIVIAAVVLGPGSIVSASRVACEYGMSLLWVVPLAGLLMTGMTIASMIIGVCREQTLCQSVAETFGRPAAWLVGGSLMIAIVLFQASNNNAMLMAAGGFIGPEKLDGLNPLTRALLLLGVNAAIVLLLVLGRRDLYRIVEKLMAVLVGMMVLAFGMSMFASKPAWLDVAAGLVPSIGTVGQDSNTVSLLSIGAMIATTFSVAGAFYQSYQVKEKGWTEQDLRLGVIDSVVGIASLSVITCMIFVTAATALYGQIRGSELKDASVVAMSLEPLFGSWARFVFACGIFAGAASSFLVNALIGGVVFCDCLGLSSRLSTGGVRTATMIALILGWFVASTVAVTGMDLVTFIVVAQSLTMVCFPLLAAVIVWQLGKVESRLVPLGVKPICWLGLLIVMGLSVKTMWGLVN
jgi:Mn2+/Fe2+ NRAMP family transporter